ncbi:MAG: DUF5103 domain-containing protein [Muribaculaceae bacterium]|nr:DUF5103 domain-containing protein [Muribaculaceae bacterium]
MKRIIFSILLLCGLCAFASTEQQIFDPQFRTLRVQLVDYPDAPPVIMANSVDRIEISFDEFSDERTYLRYELIHCDAEWRPEGLVDSEFLDGFNIADVEDWAFSRNTLAHYVHYAITLPNEQMVPLISGNYLVRVFKEEDPDTTVLQARFSIVEPLMKVQGDVTSRTDIETNDRMQQVEFVVDTQEERVDNLYGGDLKVIVSQNGRQDNELMVRSPLRVDGTKAVYEHMRPLIFPAGNEYRRFEVSSVHFPGMRVKHVLHAEPFYHFELWDDEPRFAQRYTYDSTQFGRFRVREYNSAESDLEADYVIVHFTLTMPEMPDWDIYLDGDFTYRKFSDQYRMRYNAEKGCYESAQLLKQGAYNYLYLALPKDRSRTPFSLTERIEGDFYNTVNEYVVKVYYRPPGTRYDRLMGITTLYSGQ